LKKPELRSVRTKMVLAIVPVVAGAILLVTLLAISRSGAAEKKTVYGEAQQLASTYAEYAESDVQYRMSLAKTLGTTMEAWPTADRGAVSAILKRLLLKDPSIAGTYVGYEPNAFPGGDASYRGLKDGTTDQTGRFIPYWNRLGGKVNLTPLVGYDTDAYYQLPKRTRKPQVIEPYLYTGFLMTSYIVPILRHGKFVGIAGDDHLLGDINQKVRTIRFLKTGYAFLVSNTGIFVSAPEQKVIGRKTLGQLAAQAHDPRLATMAKAIAAGKPGRISATDPFTGKHSEFFWAPVPTGKWGMVVVAPQAEVLAKINHLRTILLLVGLVALLIVAALVVLLAQRFAKPVVALAAAADRIAEGDVDVVVDARSKDEIGRMAAAFQRMVAYIGRNAAIADGIARGDLQQEVEPRSDRDVLGHSFKTMVENLRRMIGEVAAAAEELTESSTKMATSSSEVGRAVEEISRAVGDVAAGADRQVQMVDRARSASDESGAAATQAKTLARDGVDTIERAAAAMDELQQSTDHVTTAIRELAEKSDKIGSIVETITSIAGQTNLLALNAAIEAARAGEQGRGFAVVADEVRKLAEESQAAAASIAGLIAQIQSETEKTVAIVERGARQTVDSGTLVVSARESFEQIATAVDALESRIAEIVAATTEVAAVAQESSASTEEVSASTEETAATAQEAAAGAQQLAATADRLGEVVGSFS
jgi:methyl-accepting chemotaxis protein